MNARVRSDRSVNRKPASAPSQDLGICRMAEETRPTPAPATPAAQPGSQTVGSWNKSMDTRPKDGYQLGADSGW